MIIDNRSDVAVVESLAAAISFTVLLMCSEDEMKLNQEKSFPRSSRRLAWGGVAIAVVLCLYIMMAAGCQTGDDEPTDVEAQGTKVETEVEDSSDYVADDATGDSSDESAETETETKVEIPEIVPLPPEEGWAMSSHADTYVISTEGKNDTCARCHSPVQWLPGPEDIPESCLACKFDVDVPPPLFSEEEWEHVPCKTCHRTDGDDVEEEIAWLEIPSIEEYIDMDSTTKLCRKCHEMSDFPDHKPAIVVSEEHADLLCTECHDAHSNIATCAKSGCHESVLIGAELVPGHDEEHTAVSCTACHDAAGLQVGPSEDSDMWVTYVSLMLDGEETLLPHSSHTVQTQVACDRCHFDANPWELSEDVASGS